MNKFIKAFRSVLSFVVVSSVVAGGLTLYAPSSNVSAATVPCKYNGKTYDKYKEYNCTFYKTSPVVNNAGKKVGTLHSGTNWILCQQQGSTVRSGSTYNNWWAYTKADNGKMGWVNAYYGKGGSNNQPFKSVPLCYNGGNPTRHGYAPGVTTTCFNRGGNTITKPSRYCAGRSGNSWTCIGNTFTNSTANYYREYGYYGPDCYVK